MRPKVRVHSNATPIQIMKKLFLALAMMAATLPALADGVCGFWKTIDDETHEPKSIVQIYEYQNKVYGRVVEILTKEPDAKAKLPGSPAIKGLDIIWDLTKDGNKYTGGEVLDPQKGKVYDCEIWCEKGNLIVRGKIAFIGRNQTWLPAKDYKPASKKAPTPKKPKLK